LMTGVDIMSTPPTLNLVKTPYKLYGLN